MSMSFADMKVSFLVNSYDADGDLIEKEIILRIGNFSMHLDSIESLNGLIKNLENIKKEILEN